MSDAQPPTPLSFWHPAHLIATWGGAGLLKPAPGTWGSLAALPFAWGLMAWLGPIGLAVAAVLVFAAGCWATARYAQATGGHDPSEVVVDEVAGQWLTLLLGLTLLPAAADPWLFAAGFLLFRAFDIVKPWPIRYAERRVPGALGVMLDDVLAAVYAGVLLYLLGRYLELG